MKKIYWMFLLTALLACSEKKNEAVSLDGEIKGLGNDTLYIAGVDRLYDQIDTLIVVNDRFSSTLYVDTLVETRLLFADGNSFPLYLNKGNKIIIKGDTANLTMLEIEGNQPNRESTSYHKELQNLGHLSEIALQEKADSFITNHPSSLFNLYLIDEYFVQKPQPDYKRIERLVEKMTGELKDRPYIETLLKTIKDGQRMGIGKMSPTFRLKDIDGKIVSRSDFKDTYLLLHVWASWDTLSRVGNQLYRDIYKKEKKNKKFTLLGISLDSDKNQWQKAVEEDSLKWTQVYDPAGWNSDFVEQLDIWTLPANILLAPNGRIEGRNLNGIAIERKIKEIEEKEKAKAKREADKKRKR